MRAADTDRERVAEQLRTAHGEGRLSLAEYDERVTRVWAAQTYDELDTLIADLPLARAAVVSGQRPVNGFAVASLVLGTLWIFWIGSILALVYGYIARRQINRSGGRGAGLATAGIVLGWVGVGILATLLIFGLLAGVAQTGAGSVPPPPISRP